MFQVEPILWLQSHASGPLTSLMWGITLFGYLPAYVVLVLILAFGVKLRPSLGVALALLVAAVLTDGLKDGMGLPRPYEIDARVIEPWGAPSEAAVARGAAPSFWALPSADAIAAVRARAASSDVYGFPSGHVSSAVALALGAAWFFRSKRLVILAAIWPLLMALSRMYLGRHFLADVLGGMAVGIVATVTAALLTPQSDRAVDPRSQIARYFPLLAVAALLLILVPFVPLIPARNTGELAGLAGISAWLSVRGFPGDEATVARRFGRVALAVLLYVGLYLVADAAVRAIGWHDVRLRIPVVAFLVTAGTFFGCVSLARRWRWYAAP